MPNKPILRAEMKSKAKTDRTQNHEMARIHRENIASRKRVMRARALGEKSKEFCLADHMGDMSLDFSRIEAPDDLRC